MCIGENDKENCIEDGMYGMQVQKTNSTEKMQALWTGWWQEEEGEYKHVRKNIQTKIKH